MLFYSLSMPDLSNSSQTELLSMPSLGRTACCTTPTKLQGAHIFPSTQHFLSPHTVPSLQAEIWGQSFLWYLSLWLERATPDPKPPFAKCWIQCAKGPKWLASSCTGSAKWSKGNMIWSYPIKFDRGNRLDLNFFSYDKENFSCKIQPLFSPKSHRQSKFSCTYLPSLFPCLLKEANIFYHRSFPSLPLPPRCLHVLIPTTNIRLGLVSELQCFASPYQTALEPGCFSTPSSLLFYPRIFGSGSSVCSAKQFTLESRWSERFFKLRQI